MNGKKFPLKFKVTNKEEVFVMETYTCNQIYSLITKQYKRKITIRTIRNWFKNSIQVNDPNERPAQYSAEEVADILASHGILQLKISLLQHQLNTNYSEQDNDIKIGNDNIAHSKNINNSSELMSEDDSFNVIKIKLLEKFITQNTDYKFCDEKFRHDLQSKYIYDESISNLFSPLGESELLEVKKAAMRIESLDLKYYFKQKSK